MGKLKILIFIVLSFLPLAVTVIDAGAASRTALVIGNASYESSDVPPLENPANDAADMADALRNLGFEVIEKINAGRREMDNAVQQFYRSLNSAEAGLFFYAGHGMQIAGENFLIPVDIAVASPADIKFRAVGASWILAKMEDAKSRVNIVILDACRDNPFRGLRGGSQGLAPIQSVRGSFVAYSTSPGAVAQDGTGRNGVYTKHLLKVINRTGLTVEETFREVRKAVAQETDYQQIPWDSSSLMGAFYLAGGSEVVSKPDDEQGDKQATETGSLTIKTKPKGAYIKINDTSRGPAPISLSGMKPVNYRVRAEMEGYKPEQKQVRVRAGSIVRVQFYLDEAEETGRLYVQPDPEDARVRIMNVVPKYYEGIELEPGKYHIRVDKDGYRTKDRWVKLEKRKKLDVSIELEKKPEKGQLYVRTEPEDCQVSVVNIDRDYYSGIKLNAGRYKVKAAKTGYEEKNKWVFVSAGRDVEVKIKLKPLAAIINRDGVYVAYANGIVRDTSTGLEWKAGQNKSMTWNQAQSWVQSLGSDWRMPTTDELKTLYKKGKGERNRTPLLKISGWCFWSGETKGSSAAWVFHFYNGDRGWDGRSASFYNNWAFAVHSRVKGKKMMQN